MGLVVVPFSGNPSEPSQVFENGGEPPSLCLNTCELIYAGPVSSGNRMFGTQSVVSLEPCVRTVPPSIWPGGMQENVVPVFVPSESQISAIVGGDCALVVELPDVVVETLLASEFDVDPDPFVVPEPLVELLELDVPELDCPEFDVLLGPVF